LFYYQNRCWE